ncbi:MAG: hypothetical protein KKE20_02940 [Nanoarchaeota archaeon]|nr:hypothetical protein [Nanoarchaeota archaeon]
MADDNGFEHFLDDGIVGLLGDLEKSDFSLSTPDTDKAVDYATMRLATSIALEGHEELGLDSKFNVDEYAIIREAFKDDYGDEGLVLMMFYKQLHEIVVDHVINGKHKLNQEEETSAERKRKMIDLIINEVREQFYDLETQRDLTEVELDEERQAVQDLLQIQKVLAADKLSFPNKCSRDYVNEIVDKIITENRVLALNFAKKAKEEQSPAKSEKLRQTGEYYARIYNNLNKWKHQFSPNPLWGKALAFLDSIDFPRQYQNYDRKKELAVKAALELYDITALDLKSIAKHYKELKEFYQQRDIPDGDGFGKEEARHRTLSKNSRKGQMYISYLMRADVDVGCHVARDIFGYDNDQIDILAKTIMQGLQGETAGFEFETDKLCFSVNAVDDYIQRKRLGKKAFREEERSRLKLKKLKSESDYARQSTLDTIENLAELVKFAFSDNVYTPEEIEIISLLAGIKYGVRDDSVIDDMLSDAKDMKIVVLDNDQKAYSSLATHLKNTSCQLHYTSDFGDLYDKHINSDEPPQVIFIGYNYSGEGYTRADIIEFLMDEMRSSQTMKAKNIQIYVLGSTLKDGGTFRSHAKDASEQGTEYVSILDSQRFLNIIHDYGMEKPDTSQPEKK